MNRDSMLAISDQASDEISREKLFTCFPTSKTMEVIFDKMSNLTLRGYLSCQAVNKRSVQCCLGLAAGAQLRSRGEERVVFAENQCTSAS